MIKWPVIGESKKSTDLVYMIMFAGAGIPAANSNCGNLMES
jgi:hypothetical protein